MNIFPILLKNIPWKKLSTWAVVVLVLNLLVFWIYNENSETVPVELLYVVVVGSLLILAIYALVDAISEFKKIDTKKAPFTEQTFEKDVDAECSEFGVIKDNSTSNGKSKLTFKGKVNAPGSKFGNIEK